MLVVTANWSWTDGTLVPNRAGRGSAWLRDVHRAVLRAGFRRDGRYRPIEALDIVFAGDTFDALLSRRWTDRLRPWHGGPQAAAMRDQTLVEAARRARRLLAGLARWARDGMALPLADRRGRPLPQATTRAAVRVTLLTGDRDRWLTHAADVAARHRCRVGHVWADDGNIIRHGAEFDPCWCDVEAVAGSPAGVGDDALSADWLGATRPRPPFLGESVVVDLVARFAAGTLDHGPAIPSVSRLIGRLASAAPLAIPATFANWLTDRHEGAALAAGQRQRIESEWRRAVAAWHREARRVPPSCGIEACPIDWLAGWFERPATVVAPLDMAARFAPRPPKAGRSPVSLVLGHVAGVQGAVAVDRISHGVVCLGPEPCVGHDPPTVVRGRLGWAPLLAAAPATGMRLTAAAAIATIRSEGTDIMPLPGRSRDGETDVNAAA